MNTIFMNSKGGGTSDLTDKINLEVTNMLRYQTLAFTIYGKI